VEPPSEMCSYDRTLESGLYLKIVIGIVSEVYLWSLCQTLKHCLFFPPSIESCICVCVLAFSTFSAYCSVDYLSNLLWKQPT
jgi:hypothetical protein